MVNHITNRQFIRTNVSGTNDARTKRPFFSPLKSAILAIGNPVPQRLDALINILLTDKSKLRSNGDLSADSNLNNVKPPARLRTATNGSGSFSPSGSSYRQRRSRRRNLSFRDFYSHISPQSFYGQKQSVSLTFLVAGGLVPTSFPRR